MRRLKEFFYGASAHKGTTSVEMALIAPVFFLLFIGLTEVSLMMLAQHLMENATYNASRLGKTGYIPEGQTQEQAITSRLYTELGALDPLIDVSKVSMTTENYGSLGEIGTGTAGTGFGTAGQIVIYTVSYPWKIFTPGISDLMGDENDVLTLTSRLVVKNEPY